jgi:hypothetical protein
LFLAAFVAWRSIVIVLGIIRSQQSSVPIRPPGPGSQISHFEFAPFRFRALKAISDVQLRSRHFVV